MLKFLIVLVTALSIGTCGKQSENNKLFCVREAEGGIDQKVRGAKIVIAGYTRSVYETEAEFLVFSVIKGEEQLSTLFKNRKLSPLEIALNRRLVNVTSFSVKPNLSDCQKSIRVGETYFVFARLNRILILDGDDGIQNYSKAKEEEMRKLLVESGGIQTTQQWDEWSPCSKSCGGGLQTRRRKCESITCRTAESPVQQRSCNTFSCTGLSDVLEVVGLRETGSNPADRPTAYSVVSKKSSWTSTAAAPDGFPKQFSLLIAVRATSSSFSGFLFRMLQNDIDIQLALHFSSDTVSLILPDLSYSRFKQNEKLVENTWYWMSFSVSRGKVTYFLDCKPSGVSTVSSLSSIEDFGSDEGAVKYVVGGLSNRDRTAFQGDIEQLLFAEAPSAAAEQCSVVVEEQSVVGAGTPTRSKSSLKNTKQNGDDEFTFSEDASGDVYEDEYEDETAENKPSPDIKKAVLLLSESPVKDDDEVIEDVHHLMYDVKPDQQGSDDDEYDDEEDEETGSGSSLNVPEWSDWSECSKTCNWGVRYRTMMCKDSEWNTGVCYSNEKQTEACFLAACPPPPTTKALTTVKPTTQKKVTTHKRVSSNSWRNTLPNIVSKPSQSKASERVVFTRPTKATEKYSTYCKFGCHNGGYCNNRGACVCRKGFSGKFCEKVTCEGLCENGGTCTKYGRCICRPGYYGFLCELRKCKFVAVKRPYQKSFKKRFLKEEKYPCGAWGWKKCTRTKVHYAPEFKTFYRTEYVCDSANEILK